MKALLWVEYYARLLNVEFWWPSNKFPEVSPEMPPPPPPPPHTHTHTHTHTHPPSVSAPLICKALSEMKCGKPPGPSDIIAEMLKAAGEEGVELAKQLADAVFICSVSPSATVERFIKNLYKGKG